MSYFPETYSQNKNKIKFELDFPFMQENLISKVKQGLIH